jgi:hypothetical protein
MSSWRTLLERQDLVLTRAQALRGGMSKAAWEWKLARGVWRPVLHGVVVAHTGEPTRRERTWAACLYGGRGAALSGDAALVQLGVERLVPRTVDVAVPLERRVRPARLVGGPAVVPHRVQGLQRWEHPGSGPALLTAHAAVLHAAAWAPTDRAAEGSLAAVVQSRLSAPRLIREALAQMSSLHRRALIREVLDDVELGAHATSELEFLRFCRRNGLPLPDELQVRVRAGGVRYLDARYRRQRVTVELDGAHHRLVGQW